jgi:hypothetical protein
MTADNEPEPRTNTSHGNTAKRDTPTTKVSRRGGLDKGAVQSPTKPSAPSRATPPGESIASVELRAESGPSPGGTFTAELGPIEMKAGDEVGARANAAGWRKAAAGTPIVGKTLGEESVGRAIVSHRQEILESGPGLKEAIKEVLAYYDENLPNDPDIQQFVVRLRTLSNELDTYLAMLQTEPTDETEAEHAGNSLFKEVLSAIKELEKTTTGDKFVRLTACAVLLALAAIAAPMVSPYLTVPLMTSCVFPKETMVATGLFKVVEGIARRVGVLPSKSEEQ